MDLFLVKENMHISLDSAEWSMRSCRYKMYVPFSISHR